MKHKYEVFSIFEKWKIEVENQDGMKIKKLRIDNEEESDRWIQDFLWRQSGVAESMNLPEEFWIETVNTAAYFINKIPPVLLGMKILQEVWFGKEVAFEHLRMFGCAQLMSHIKEER